MMFVRRLCALLLASTLVACGAPQTNPDTVAQQPTITPAASAPASPAATQPPSSPAAQPTATTLPPTLVPASTVVPTAVPTAVPQSTAQPTAVPQPTVAATAMPSSAPAAEGTTVTGTINYDSSVALPANAALTVRLIGHPGLGQSVLSEQVFAPVPTGPVAFTLPYTSQWTDIEWHRITVEAEISADEIILLKNNEPAEVLTPDKPRTATLTLTPPANLAVLSGTISYPADVTLPPDATLRIWMMDEQIGPWAMVGQRTITPVPGAPIPFKIQYGSWPGSESRLMLYASVRDAEDLLLVTSAPPAFATPIKADAVELVLERPAALRTISGTVTYPVASGLPADAQLTVKIIDVSGADAPETVICEQRLAPSVSQPTPFEVECDPTLIKPNRIYAISAQIDSGEQLLYVYPFLDEIDVQQSQTGVTIPLEALPQRP